jgi:glutathione synthase/RimK-type ligase-like ATP-grasp enzyme
MKETIFKLLVLPSVPNMQQVIDRFPFPIKLTKGQYKNLEIIFQNGHVIILHKGVDIRDFSFVWLCSSWSSRDLAYAIQLYLEQYKTPYTHVEKGTSKITDHMIFCLNGIPSPNTLFIGHKDVEKNLIQIKDVCGYPLVIKDIRGSQGIHSVKVAEEEELIQKMKALPKHKKFLFQKYIPNDYDWGIMVANGVVVSGEKSYPCQGEFRNNTCNGAEEIFIDPADIPEHIKKIAIKTSNALGLSWSRSDIVIDKNTQTPYVMEVNRLPGISSKTSEVAGAYAFLSSQIESFTRKT